MSRSSLRSFLVALALCAPPAAASAATTPKEAARADFDRGLTLATKGDYTEAIAAFNRAYRLSPHFAVLFNLGQAYAGAGKPVLAADTLKKYLADGGAQIPPARRKRAEEDIVQQERLIALVTIHAQIAGAMIRVDGADVGKTPLPAPVRVARGTHVFAGTAPGYRPWERTIELRGEEQRVVEVSFERPGPPEQPIAPAPAPATLPASVPPTAPSAVTVTPSPAPTATTMTPPSGSAPVEAPARSEVKTSLVVGGLGLVAGGVAAALLIWNKNRYDDWSASDRRLAGDPQQPDYSQRQQENDELARSIRTTSIVTVSTAIAGAALLATGVVLHFKEKRPRELPAGPSQALRVGPGFVDWRVTF